LDKPTKSTDCSACQAEQLAETEALKRLNDASSRLWRTSSLRVGLVEMLIATVELLGADMGNVQIVDAASGKLRISAQKGFEAEFLDFFREVAADDGCACGRALRSGDRVIVEDVEQDPLFASCLHIVRNAGFRAVQSTPLIDRKGKALGMISTHFRSPHRPSELDLQRLDLYARQASDFIERCRAEEELRARAEEHEALLDALPAFIWFGDADYHVIRGNRAANEMTGVAAGVNVSQSAVATGQATYPHQLKQDGTEYRPEELPIQTAVATRRTVRNAYIDFRFPDGRRVETIGNATPLLDASGAVRGGVGAFIDVSERNRAEWALRESEEFNRTIIESSPDCVKVLDLDGRLLMINESGRRLLGIDDVSPLLGKDWRVLWPWTWGSDILMDVKAGRTCRFQESHPTFHGLPKWWDVIVTPVRGNDGAIVRILSIARDVTDRKQAEDALREADRRKDEFLAILAHELRNPLAPLSNAVHLLQKAQHDAANADDRTSVLLRMAENQVNHLVRLVDDLLEVSRITTGRIELKTGRTDLAAVVRQALETSQPLIAAGRHEVSVDLGEDALMVDADPVRLVQVFANLFNNAAKYTPPAGRILISMEGWDGAGVVRVRDTGVGIPSEMLSHIFELFTQLDRSRGRANGGIGVGLALSKQLVELHGGEIEALSAGVGKGSEFIVRLPLATNSSERHAPPTDPKSRSKPGLRRVLVVDDNPAVADSLVMLLESFNVSARATYSGADALRFVEEFDPDLAFIDIGMPEMDGYETARNIRKLPEGPGIVLAALSGWGRAEDRRRGADAGFDHHFVKPLDIAVLEGLLASLNKRR
jgi:PAS domain S-box-containing protein